MRSQIAVSLLFVLCAIPALADQVTLKNGDRLTGTIIKSDGKDLVLKTDFAGDVTVKFDAIQGITSTGDLHVVMSDGKTAVGPVSTNGDNVVVATRAAGPVETPKTSITTLRSTSEQAAYEKSLHPGLAEGWDGGLKLGFALTRGNSATKNLNIAFLAVRKGFKDKLSLYSNSIYATNDVSGASPSTTANAIGGGARYDHDLSPRIFAFVNGDFDHDELQSLDLRSIFGGGLGWHAIKSDSTTLDLLAGVNYTHEGYSVPLEPAVPSVKSRSLAGLTLGDEFMHKGEQEHCDHAKPVLLSRPDQYRRVSRSLCVRHGDEAQQVAGLAELVRRLVRKLASAREKEERHSILNRTELLVHALRSVVRAVRIPPSVTCIRGPAS